MSSIAANASLVLATFQLLEVQSVLGAIHAADAETAIANQRTNAFNPQARCDSYCRQNSVHAARSYLPPRLIHAADVYLPPRVIHSTRRLQIEAATAVQTPCPAPHITAGPQGPGTIQPWQEPVPTRIVVKMTIRRPDEITKGNLIDLFV